MAVANQQVEEILKLLAHYIEPAVYSSILHLDLNVI